MRISSCWFLVKILNPPREVIAGIRLSGAGSSPEAYEKSSQDGTDHIGYQIPSRILVAADVHLRRRHHHDELHRFIECAEAHPAGDA